MGILRVPALFVLILLLSAAAVSAHSPQVADGNSSPETAMPIEDTVKSLAIYSHLQQGEALYYEFDIEEGDRLLLNLIVPVKDGDDGFLPGMAFMAPGIANQGVLPSWVEVPEGYGYVVIDTARPGTANYEGFSPSSFYDLGRMDGPAPVSGKYFVTVFAPASQEGNFALVVGYGESFTVQEWLLMPFSLFAIYQWEGQGQLEILAPFLFTCLLGALLIMYYHGRRAEPLDLQHSLFMLSGLLLAGTAAITLYQTLVSVRDSHLGPEVLISLFLFMVHGLLGAAVSRRGWMAGPLTNGGRARMAIVGLVAMIAWAGYLVGPILMIVAALLPERAAGWPRQNTPK